MGRRNRIAPHREGARHARAGNAGELALPAPAKTDQLGALAVLRERRAPYGELLAGVVAEVLEEFPPTPSDKMVAEIGAGDGQLREWLPATLRASWGERLVHTDPSEAALRELRQRAPSAKTRVATAEHLPFADQSCGAVLGLCVFDAIEDEAAVVAEAARVLCPGGRFVHFMDMATLLEAPFKKLAASGLVPLPNVFGDPADHDWPLDIVLVRRDWLAGLLDLAARDRHALSTAFGGYFKTFLVEPFDATLATNSFKAIASNGGRRIELASLMGSAARAAFQQGYPAIEPLPFQSARYLESVLQTRFRENDAFRIERCEIVTRSSWGAAVGGAAVGGARAGYRSLCVGHERISDRLPSRLLTSAAAVALKDDGANLRAQLVEVGVFVFVARHI